MSFAVQARSDSPDSSPSPGPSPSPSASPSGSVSPVDDHAGCAAELTPWTQPTTIEWVSNAEGEPTDVVGIYIHGSLDTVVSAFEQTGWTKAFSRNFGTDVLYGIGFVLDIGPAVADWGALEVEKVFNHIFHWPRKIHEIPNPVNVIVQRMPVSPEQLCGYKSLLAMEMNNNPIGGRDHFRVYSLPQKDAQGRPVWAIAASRDVRIKFDIHAPGALFLTHVPESDEDFERDFVLESLKNMNVIERTDVLQLAPTGVAESNGAYSKDGRVYDVVIADGGEK